MLRAVPLDGSTGLFDRVLPLIGVRGSQSPSGSLGGRSPQKKEQGSPGGGGGGGGGGSGGGGGGGGGGSSSGGVTSELKQQRAAARLAAAKKLGCYDARAIDGGYRVQEYASGSCAFVPAALVPLDKAAVERARQLGVAPGSVARRRFRLVLRELEVREDDVARCERQQWEEAAQEARARKGGANWRVGKGARDAEFEKQGDELGAVLRVLGEELAQPQLTVSALPPLPREFALAGGAVHLSPTHYSFGATRLDAQGDEQYEDGGGGEAGGAAPPMAMLFVPHCALHPASVRMLRLCPPDGHGRLNEGRVDAFAGASGAGRRRGWHWENTPRVEPCGVNLVRCPISMGGTFAPVHPRCGAERVRVLVLCSMAVVLGGEGGEARKKKQAPLEVRVWAFPERPGQAERVAALEARLAQQSRARGWAVAADAEVGRCAEPLLLRRGEKITLVGGRATMRARNQRRPSITMAQRVQARWRGRTGIGWFNAQVTRIWPGSVGSTDAHFDLSFDGKIQKNTPRDEVATVIHVDDAVLASAGDDPPWFGSMLPGRVLRAKHNGTYDVLLDDGSSVGLEKRMVDRGGVCPLPEDYDAPVRVEEQTRLTVERNVLQWQGEAVCTVATLPFPSERAVRGLEVYEDVVFVRRETGHLLQVPVRIPIVRMEEGGL
jgi:hypothetical protein